ncbi:MAG: glycosyl hydrolase family 28-related protein [Kiritimatiellia bacterium]|nr:glycosyl hydrolase family 28-related protein [Kiritimatiellia bacterium]MDP6847684.1 glycosyl hydrolase family 28-related protein [Kiritimatiellia bacterium]
MRKHLYRSLVVVQAIVVAAVFGCSALGQEHSELWGKNGEVWTPQSRLPDFSFAGYHFGEDPLPRPEAVTDVRSFGAKGDGKTDCTRAFIKAVEATDKGAIRIPAGHYVISDIIWIKKPNIVLRGAGPGKTVIHVTAELEDVRPNMGATTGGRPTSNYSWSGGFIWISGHSEQRTISAITSESTRGSKEVTVQKSEGLEPGQRVAVALVDDKTKSLLNYLYSGDPGNTGKIRKPVSIQMVSRIASVRGNRITLERPLRFDIRKSWTPVLKAFNPTVSEVGIEDLSITFPVKPYRGHFTERGMNGIALNGVSDCWVRNVRISNCDSAIYVSGMFCTVDGLVVDSRRPANRGVTGHHGISYGTDCLVQNFDLRTHFIHDITLSHLQAGNVTKNGRGINLSLDHHKGAPYENLFCNLDAGKGTEIWRCGGGRDLGKHCGARGTFWCINSQQDIKWPWANFGPDSMILVGVKTSATSTRDPNGKWFEAIPPDKLQPADLHAAQLSRRLGKKSNN